MGTQDDLAFAEEFVAVTGIQSVQMLWDPTFDAWNALEIVSQPAWGLFSPSGEFLEGGYGGIDETGILNKVRSI